MAESTDKKTRKIAEKRVEAGKEFESYQEAQNQLLAIQAEQQQNLALQANDAMNIQQQNQTLAQAAEVMNLNPETQGVLAGYGLSQPKVIKQSNTQRQGPNNITINNTTINNASGPVQGREISIRPQEAGQSKFKAWLTNVFARQDAQWQKQNQEYARRESSLTRNANKMMRKLEGLGKEIGNAVDPRKQAQRAQNSTMNLLKALGLVYFAKKLPDIFKFFNGAEKKIKGWVEEIKDKINFEGLVEKISDSIHNQNETGVLDIVLKKINEWLSNQIELANRTSPIDASLLKPGASLKSFANWLSIVLGGTKAANKLVNTERRLDLIGDLSKQNKKSEDFQVETLATGYEDKEMLDNRGKRILMGGYKRGDAIINSDISSESLYSEFESWAKDKGLRTTKNNMSEFLRQRDDVSYAGESVILTKHVHDSAKQGYLVFSDEDLNFWKNGISNENWYGPLAASLDIVANINKKKIITKKMVRTSTAGQQIAQFKEENKSILPNRILLLLNLLLKAAKKYGPQPVFPSFLDYFFSSEDLSTLEENSNLIKAEFKLIRERMTEHDRQKYWPKNMKGYSNFYQKIVENRVSGAPIKLNDVDFEGVKGASKWQLYKISASGIAEILERTTKSQDETYTEEAQRHLIDYLVHNKSISTNQTVIYDKESDYEELMDNIAARQSEENQFKLNQALSKETDKTSTYNRETSNSYITSNKSNISQEIPKVCYVEKSSDFSSPYSATEKERELSPRLTSGKSIKGVTKAFGGNGALVSNFMEWREKQNGTSRYHYGVDMRNSAGNEVLFPGEGTITSVGGSKDSGTHIDILDDNGYTTRYWHTRLYGGLQVGSRVLPGQPVGITEAKGENGNKYDPHIHVEVHDPDWSKSSNTEHRHKHYVNPLIYWNTHKATKYSDEVGQVEAMTQSSVPEVAESREPIKKMSSENGGPTINETPEINSPVIAKKIIPLTPSSTKLVPTNIQNQTISENNNSELLRILVEKVSLITQSSGYTASAISPLVNNMNAGFTMVTEATSKSGAPTNLTPHEPQLEMNQV